MILALIVAFALGITGGVYSAYSSPSAQSSAQTYQHAVGALFAASFGIMIIESALAVPRWHYIIRGDRKLLLAIGLAFPFMFVRLLYVEFNDFKVDYAVMNTISGSVVVQAFMSSLEEFIVVAIFLTAGWLTPRIERRQLNPARYVGDAARDGKTGGNGKQCIKYCMSWETDCNFSGTRLWNGAEIRAASEWQRAASISLCSTMKPIRVNSIYYKLTVISGRGLHEKKCFLACYSAGVSGRRYSLSINKMP